MVKIKVKGKVYKVSFDGLNSLIKLNEQGQLDIIVKGVI